MSSLFWIHQRYHHNYLHSQDFVLNGKNGTFNLTIKLITQSIRVKCIDSSGKIICWYFFYGSTFEKKRPRMCSVTLHTPRDHACVEEFSSYLKLLKRFWSEVFVIYQATNKEGRRHGIMVYDHRWTKEVIRTFLKFRLLYDGIHAVAKFFVYSHTRGVSNR